MKEKILTGDEIKELRSQNWKACLSSYQNHHYDNRSSVEGVIVNWKLKSSGNEGK